MNTTIEPYEGGKKLFFAYIRETSINHDPKLGVPHVTLPSDPGVLVGANLISHMLALAVGGFTMQFNNRMAVVFPAPLGPRRPKVQVLWRTIISSPEGSGTESGYK